jgi:hypothetical protein
MVVGVPWYLGFSTDQARATIYSGPVGSLPSRVEIANVETAAPTLCAIGGGAVVTNDSNPIASFAAAKFWSNQVLSYSDFVAESRQFAPVKPGAWAYWRLRGAADVVDAVQRNVLVKIATGTAGNSDGWEPSLVERAVTRSRTLGAKAALAPGPYQAPLDPIMFSTPF